MTDLPEYNYNLQHVPVDVEDSPPDVNFHRILARPSYYLTPNLAIVIHLHKP